MLFFLGILLAKAISGLAQPSFLETYYIPLPEPEMYSQIFRVVNSGGTTNSTIVSTISFAIAASGTKIYYYHWEDGYLTPEIWGDGNLTNGAPPGSKTDLLSGGQAIVLENLIPFPRGVTRRYDGRDRIRSTLPIAMTRSAYPSITPGALMAGAVEVFDTSRWGREFISPLGVDTPNFSGSSSTESTVLFCMAAFDGTVINLPDGSSKTLNEGQTFGVSNVKQGDQITSDRPIQVHLLTGDLGDSYELRWSALYPFSEWGNEYYSPVAETKGSTGFFLRNQNNISISIAYDGGNAVSGSVTIGPFSTNFIRTGLKNTGADITINDGNATDGLDRPLSGPNQSVRYSGLRFRSTNRMPFFGLCYIDNAFGNYEKDDGQIYDWDFPLIPVSQLTSQALIGRGSGCTSPQCNKSTATTSTLPRSVVWVTPVNNTNVFVDFNGDGIFDSYKYVPALKSYRITDTDKDMTGAIIFSSTGVGNPLANTNFIPTGLPVSIAVAWGQDPRLSVGGDQDGLDYGTAVLPLGNPSCTKKVTKIVNPDGTEDPDQIVDQVGDIIHYEIIVANTGFSDLLSVVVKDPLITNQTGSFGALTGPIEVPRAGLLPNEVLNRGDSFIYSGQYIVKPSDILSNGSGNGNIENKATITSLGFPPVNIQVESPIKLASIGGFVRQDIDNQGLGGIISGDIPIPGVLITLQLMANTAIVSTTLTNLSGFYIFSNVQGGNYVIIQKNQQGFLDAADKDGGTNLNRISLYNITGGKEYPNNDFVDYLPAPSASPSNFPSVNPSLIPSKTPSTTPSATPSKIPSKTPSTIPSLTPTKTPSTTPSVTPSRTPSKTPSVAPSKSPSKTPSSNPSLSPSTTPSVTPSKTPSKTPSTIPSVIPSETPSTTPSVTPSKTPSVTPSTTPSLNPSTTPSVTPSKPPSTTPSVSPSKIPSTRPSMNPSTTPSVTPSMRPSRIPSTTPSVTPSMRPSRIPSFAPSLTPSMIPSPNPSMAPSITPSLTPSKSPSLSPSRAPSMFPSLLPSSNPSATPSMLPSLSPSKTPSILPSLNPSVAPSAIPSILRSVTPSASPSLTPTLSPSKSPSLSPSNVPSLLPSLLPSLNPSVSPSKTPSTPPSLKPSVTPSLTPTVQSSNPPSTTPTSLPSVTPSLTSSVTPSATPSMSPSLTASKSPSSNPSVVPSLMPSETPSMIPSITPSLNPSVILSVTPSVAPSLLPSLTESRTPSLNPSLSPSLTPSLIPSQIPSESPSSVLSNITGNVSEDLTNDDIGDIPLTNITVTLYNSENQILQTTQTDSFGNYTFESLVNGIYYVVESNLNEMYGDVKDSDGGVDLNNITVVLQSTFGSSGNDFVDERLGSIVGSVVSDDGERLVNVTVSLQTVKSTLRIATTLTNDDGIYVFSNIPPRDYIVVESNPPDFPVDISDYDISQDGDNDKYDNDTTVDNQIRVTIIPGGEVDDGNMFVDSNKGSISGNVTTDTGIPILGVDISLHSSQGTLLATSVTGNDGKYIFVQIPPGNYTVKESNLPEYVTSISDYDWSPEESNSDNSSSVGADDKIEVFLSAGNVDLDNNFVDKESISLAPISMSPPISATTSPSMNPSFSPSNGHSPSSMPHLPSLPPSSFCQDVSTSSSSSSLSCSLCSPFRSLGKKNRANCKRARFYPFFKTNHGSCHRLL
jgi:SdrD B-like domain